MKYWVGSEILGQEQNLGLGAKFWFWSKNLGRERNFGSGAKFWVRQKTLCGGGKEAVTFLLYLQSSAAVQGEEASKPYHSLININEMC